MGRTRLILADPDISLKGDYNASTNTPDLDTSPSAIVKGDHYIVSVAGIFFSANVEAGDSLIAKRDNPTLESHWIITQTNLDAASVKTLYESNANTNEFSDTKNTKLEGIAIGATVNDTDANLKNRANHTGSQPASTISDFNTKVRTNRLDQLAVATAIQALLANSGIEIKRTTSDQILKLSREGGNPGSGFIYSNGGDLFGVNDGTLYPFVVNQGAPTFSLVVNPSGNSVFGGHAIPKDDGGQDLGIIGKRWRNLRLLGSTIFLGDETLKIVDGKLEFSGSGGFSSPSALPEWLDLHRDGATGNQTGIKTDVDIIMDNSRGNGIAYNTSTGVATLKAGKTYRLWATFAVFSLESADTVAIEWVKASDNTRLAGEGHETRIRPANAASNGSNANTIEVIYKPTVDTDVKLRCTEYTHGSDTVTMYWERSMATIIELR